MSGLPSPMKLPAIGASFEVAVERLLPGFRLDGGGGRRDGSCALVRG